MQLDIASTPSPSLRLPPNLPPRFQQLEASILNPAGFNGTSTKRFGGANDPAPEGILELPPQKTQVRFRKRIGRAGDSGVDAGGRNLWYESMSDTSLNSDP